MRDSSSARGDGSEITSGDVGGAPSFGGELKTQKLDKLFVRFCGLLRRFSATGDTLGPSGIVVVEAEKEEEEKETDG